MDRKHEQTDVVWGRATRVFHWVNFVCILMLIILGTAILNEKMFGVSADGKILLKTLHAYVGYVFASNLLWRVIWAFFGHQNTRWRGMLPFYRGYVSDLKRYLRPKQDVDGSAFQWLGHIAKRMTTCDSMFGGSMQS